MAERVLTERELNRAVLARQGLLEPSTGSIAQTLRAIGGLQAQYAPSMYVGLWSRMAHLERNALTRALESRSVVQATLMRMTIHLVARRDYWPFALAVREARREMWIRATRGAASAEELAQLALRVREHLSAHGEISRKELDALAGKPYALGAGLWVDLVRVPPSGTWERRRADRFGLAEDWVGPPRPLTADAAAAQLVRSYLAGFGPATRADIHSYTGLSHTALGAGCEHLRLRTFRSESGDELLDVARGALPDPATPAPVRYLPTWDATLLVHARRARILPEEHRPKIFGVRIPQSRPTFLVDGAVAGAWKFVDGRIEREPFERLDRATQRALDAEGERLAAFHA